MNQVIGVRFKPAGKIYYFDSNNLDLHIDDGVIVETSRGLEYGYVVLMPDKVSEEDMPQKPVIRKATIKDMARSWKETRSASSQPTKSVLRK